MLGCGLVRKGGEERLGEAGFRAVGTDMFDQRMNLFKTWVQMTETVVY